MVYIPEIFPYEKRSWYPHMKPFDRELWDRFLDAFPDYYTKVNYSVPCGVGAPFDTLVTEGTGAHDEYNYKRKIDVVGFREDEVDIVELKPKAGSSTIGQVEMYRDLYMKDYRPSRFPNMVVITDRADTDVIEYAIRKNVKMIFI